MKKLQRSFFIFIPLFGLIFLLNSLQCFAVEEKRYEVPLDVSLRHGPPDAPVTLIEFLDFQ